MSCSRSLASATPAQGAKAFCLRPGRRLLREHSPTRHHFDERFAAPPPGCSHAEGRKIPLLDRQDAHPKKAAKLALAHLRLRVLMDTTRSGVYAEAVRRARESSRCLTWTGHRMRRGLLRSPEFPGADARPHSSFGALAISLSSPPAAIRLTSRCCTATASRESC